MDSSKQAELIKKLSDRELCRKKGCLKEKIYPSLCLYHHEYWIREIKPSVKQRSGGDIHALLHSMEKYINEE